MCSQCTDEDIQFIECAVRLDAQIVLAESLASKEGSGSVVTCSRVNAHLSFFLKDQTTKQRIDPYLCGLKLSSPLELDLPHNSDILKQMRYDEAYMRMAVEWAKLSHCSRKQVGALIVKDRMIIADGFNGTPTGFPNVCENDAGETEWYVLHAEANAITKLARSNNSAVGSTLYITMSPCRECSKLILQAGISRVVYKNSYKDAEGLDFLSQAGVDCIQLEHQQKLRS